MTTAENVGKAYMLSVVEQRIRKDIPRLMELREGCWIKQKTSEKDFLIKVVAVKNGFLNCVLGFTQIMFSVKQVVEDSESFEIIGHDIMLNDVLEWLNNKFYEKDYFITSKGIFGYRAVEYDIIETYILRGIKINLHSPYLKDQSEELINFLYNPIKE